MEKLWKSWQRKLIPLSSRNRSLVVPKTRPRFCLDLWDFDFIAGAPVHQWIEKALLSPRPFPLFPVVDSRDGRSNERSQALSGLLKTARTWKEETGAAPLQLGYLIVEGKTMDDQVVRGPLILIPVEIEAVQGQWVMTPQPPTWNQALFLAYGQSTGHIPPLDWPWDMPSVSSLLEFLTFLHPWVLDNLPGIRLDSAIFQQTLQPFPAWRVSDLQKRPLGELSILPYALLGIFPSYSSYLGEDFQYLMTNYSEEPWSKWQGNVVQTLREEEALDPLPVDASQEFILDQVQKGASLVVQGPPGSGKSQLITNLVARFTAQGKRVLVVCQKRAALETVYQRMTELGADTFVGFVTDIQRDRASVFERLRHHLARLSEYQTSTQEWEAWFQDRHFRQASRRIEQWSQALESVRTGLFTPLPMGWPLKNIYLALGDLPEGPVLSFPFFHQWTEESYHQKDQILSQMIRYIQCLDRPLDYVENGALRHRWPVRLSEEGQMRWKNYQASWEICIPDLKLIVGSLDDSSIDSFWTWWNHLKQRPACLKWLDQPIPKGVNASTENQIVQWTQVSLISGHLPLEDWKSLLERRFQQPWRKLLGLPTALKTWRLPNETEESLLSRIQQSIDWRNFRQANPWFSGENPLDWLELWQDIRWVRPSKGRFPTCPWRTPAEGLELESAWTQFRRNETAWLEEVGAYWQTSFREAPQTTFDRIELHRPYLYELTQLAQDWRVDENILLDRLWSDPDWNITLKRSWLTYWWHFGEQLYPDLSRLAVGHWEDIENRLQEAIATKQGVVRTQWIQALKAQTVRELAHNRLRNPITYRPLQHQIQKKRQIWSLRKIWQEYGEEVSRLLPCWLVSPEAAASLFPLEGKTLFDLVIFDEASQCPVEQGIPILFRGKQVVIAGDRNQLRPSDLYQSVWEEEEEENPELTLDSLLDLASWHFPTHELRGHYRSAHPDLIRFSNHHFYQNRLHCLPSFTQWKKGEPSLVYHPVSGVWDGRTNAIEAARILDWLQTEGDFTQKIGVIAFNYHQARLIEQGVDERGWTHVRVKNIENVQGDEYDIVLLSTTYGPNEKGKVQFQMGSLNRPGGENRLNVALTRARKQMHIFSSFPLNSLRDPEAHAEGVEKLKTFLLETAAYHQVGSFGEQAVSVGLATRLWGTHTFQSTPFGLLDDQDRLWLTDDGAYEQALSAKENHAYFPRSLQQKGWKFRRVWSRSWATGKNFDAPQLPPSNS